MKYIVEIEEWENNQKSFRNLGNRDALNFIENALRLATWNQPEDMEESIDRYIYEQNPQGKIEHFTYRKANPMLSILSGLRAYAKMVTYFTNTDKEKLNEFYK